MSDEQTGNIENFAIIVRVDGSTKQVYLPREQKQLFAKLCLGTLCADDNPIRMMPVDDMFILEPDRDAFSI